MFNLFGLFWCLFFSAAFEEMSMAGAFAQWYFTRDKGEVGAVTPLVQSVGRYGCERKSYCCCCCFCC